MRETCQSRSVCYPVRTRFPEGECLARELVETSLASAGYEVIGAAGASDADAAVDVRIDEFSAWFTPGFWSVSMEAVISTAVTFESCAGQLDFDVQGYGINRGQSGREGNWVEAYQRAFADYSSEFEAELERHAGELQHHRTLPVQRRF